MRALMSGGQLTELLAGRGFRYLLSVRLIGQFADGLIQAALATFVLFSPEREPGAAKVAVAFAILLIPYSVVGPFAGVFLDRWSRQRVLSRGNWIKAACTLSLVLCLAMGIDGALLGVAVLIVLGIGRFILAGLSASVPHVVAEGQLPTANALAPTSGTIAAVIGAVCGVALRGGLGGDDRASAVVVCLALACLVMAGVVACGLGRGELGPQGDRPGDSIRAVAAGLVDGALVLLASRPARGAVAVVGAHRLAFGALTVIGLMLVRNTFHGPGDSATALSDFAMLTAFAAAGALLGAIVTPAMARRLSGQRWSGIALVQAGALGMPIVLIGSLIPSLPVILGGAVSVGFAGQAVKVCCDTAVQESIHDDHLGRVFALNDMWVNVCLVAGTVLAAATIPHSGVAPALTCGLAAFLMAVGLWTLATRWGSGTTPRSRPRAGRVQEDRLPEGSGGESPHPLA